MNYEQTIKYFNSLNHFGINLGLKRIEYLLDLMGHPEKKYKTVHITGSNGKGSTAAMVSAILSSSGIKTGLYISPHLIDYTERISINEENISREDFAFAVSYTKSFVEEMLERGLEHPTEFEILTAAAFYYFAISRVEYAVIEAGLGGLLDSTNVLKQPQVSVITNVSLEHTDRCGNTIAEIAKNKAGIIKENSCVITAAKNEALDIIKNIAHSKNNDILIYEEDFFSKSEELPNNLDKKQKINVSFKEGFSDTFCLNILGNYQLENSALAVATCHFLSENENRITTNTIRLGLENVKWPGRFEILSTSPLIIIDGAHNPAGAASLRKSLDLIAPKSPITFLIGILKDKDIKGIVKNLISSKDRVIIVPVNSERAASPDEIAREITVAKIDIASSIEEGIILAKNSVSKDEILCITGSLYLIGDIKKHLF